MARFLCLALIVLLGCSRAFALIGTGKRMFDAQEEPSVRLKYPNLRLYLY
jgi:hypothetical protein